MDTPVPQPTHLVVGLGNPGPRYGTTRHNIGYRVLDYVATRWEAAPWQAWCHSLVSSARVEEQPLLLAKPHTFMNRSGRAAGCLVEQSGLEIADLVVVHDDLDLPFGHLRIRRKGGHGGHNGIRSLLDELGSDSFVRLKVGIGRPGPSQGVVEHVLTPLSPSEESSLPEVLARAAAALVSIIVEGPERAMNSLTN